MIPITTLVHEVARVFGPKPAIISDRWTVTYEELDERINRLANAFRELGLQHGDRFAVMATDSIEHIETALTISRGRCVRATQLSTSRRRGWIPTERL